jgi:hypothetical protein
MEEPMIARLRRGAIDLAWHARAFRRFYLRWRVRRFLAEERRARGRIVDQALRVVEARHVREGRPWY